MFFNTFINIEKYLDYEQRDPVALSRVRRESEREREREGRGERGRGKEPQHAYTFCKVQINDSQCG